MPLPVTVVSGGAVPAAPGARVPCPTGTVSTVWTSAVPASTSAMLMAFGPVNTSGVLPGVLWAPGTVLTGGSLTMVTSTVIVRAVWSRSRPPLAVPPLSWTWNVKLATPAPLAFAAGAEPSGRP